MSRTKANWIASLGFRLRQQSKYELSFFVEAMFEKTLIRTENIAISAESKDLYKRLLEVIPLVVQKIMMSQTLLQ